MVMFQHLLFLSDHLKSNQIKICYQCLIKQVLNELEV